MRNELLSQADLDRAGARKRATGKKLGETLQEMGLVDPEHIEDALALHVREVLLRRVLLERRGIRAQGAGRDRLRQPSRP